MGSRGGAGPSSAFPLASLSHLFPAAAAAQEDIFKQLLVARGEDDGVDDGALQQRAKAMASSVLAYSFNGSERVPTPPPKARPVGLTAEAAAAKAMIEEIDKSERRRLKNEALERADEAVAEWDSLGFGESDGAMEERASALAELKETIDDWMKDGSTREKNAAKMTQMLRVLDVA